MARVRRMHLIRREVREFLAPSALDLLLAHAETLVEGGQEQVGDEERVYVTVMVTLDLERYQAYFREPADEATAHRVAELLVEGDRLAQPLVRLARQALAKRANVPIHSIDPLLEHQLRTEGCNVLIDIDAMAVIRRGSGRWA